MVQQKWQQATYANKDQSVAACHESLMFLLQLPMVGRQIKTQQQQAMSQSASANALVHMGTCGASRCMRGDARIHTNVDTHSDIADLEI